ncbi:MAG: hypothetical protein LBG15_00295 [Dysgonamonadaceae bacterium]|jgi:hypothetical protein|nr:hypothetical protein [Dysgonamonadaceae bacterium]
MKMTPPAASPRTATAARQNGLQGVARPFAEKNKFWRYLKKYAACGLYCKRPKRLTPEREKYYERIRIRKMEKIKTALFFS